jgi:hypothetical protein
MARNYFTRMKVRAENENNTAYRQAAEQGLSRCV